MQKKKRIPFVAPLCLVCGLLAAAPSWALGFISGTASTVLGRPLDFRAVVRLDAGEPLEAQCVRAAVVVGDRSVPPQGVGVVVTAGPEGTAVVRVRTTLRIDEPIVGVEVEVGCLQRVSRSFTVFADPPAVELVAAPDALASAPATPEPGPAGGAAAPRDVPADTRAAALASTVRVVPQGSGDAAPAAAAPVERPRPRPRPRPRADAPATATATATATAAAAAPAPAAVPRLRLDAAPPPAPATPPASAPASASLPAETLALVDQANETVKAAIEAASASQARVAALERSVRELGDAAAEQRALIEQLRTAAGTADSGSRWLWPLLLAALLLAALSLWLWRRLRELEQERRSAWLAAAQAGRAAPAPAGAAPADPLQRAEVPSPSQVPLLVERTVRGRGGVGTLGAGLAPVHQPTPSEMPDTSPAQPPAWADDAVTSTQPLIGVPTSRNAEAVRDVSAEELIDLEQQAEFFVVLGQDEAAIDLLVAHLRDSGGASPLPYLKLLEIYRRRGDREAHDRTRDRFNQRFNAHAPSWEAGTVDGRGLEDYPRVVAGLQRVWPQPLEALTALESLLFGRNDGDVFDLPAYRELLLLYAVARELLDSEPGRGPAVDVLLPLGEAPAFVQTPPRAFHGDETRPLDLQPTAPLDLDLGDTRPGEPPR